MVPVRSAPRPIRALTACALALLVALRLLMPAGFMPAFDHGRIAIIACPDAGFAPAAPTHHRHGGGNDHQPCPYASAASLGGLLGLAPFAILALLLSGLLTPAAGIAFAVREEGRRRPPSRAPPGLA